MSAAPVLSVRGLSKHYRVKGTRIDALAGIDLDVWRGETMAIVGESASGKTTLATSSSVSNGRPPGRSSSRAHRSR